jgi:hypothetical protein
VYVKELEVAALLPILPPRPRNQDCHGTIVPRQGTCAASHWSETGFTVSGAEVVSIMSTPRWGDQLLGDLGGPRVAGLAVARDDLDTVLLPADGQALGERLPDLLQHERVCGGEGGVRPGHGADEADLDGAGRSGGPALEAAAAGREPEPGRSRHPANEGAAAQPGTAHGAWAGLRAVIGVTHVCHLLCADPCDAASAQRAAGG